MKALIAILMVVGVVFSALTPSVPFPSSFVAGSSYQATYVDNEVNTPYFISIMTDLMCDEIKMTLNAENCSCLNSTVSCNGTSLPMKFNMTTVFNLEPKNYSMNITVSGTKTVADAPVYYSQSYSGGGAVYFPPSKKVEVAPEPPVEPVLPEVPPSEKPAPPVVKEPIEAVVAPPAAPTVVAPVTMVTSPVAASLFDQVISNPLFWFFGSVVVMGGIAYLTINLFGQKPPEQPIVTKENEV